MDQYIRENNNGRILDYDLLDVAGRHNLLNEMRLLAAEIMRGIEKPTDYYRSAVAELDAALGILDAAIDPDTRDMLARRLAYELERLDSRAVTVTEAGARLLEPEVDAGQSIGFPGLIRLLTSYSPVPEIEVEGLDVLYGGEIVARMFRFPAPRSGTAPDTSLFLGSERKTWLAAQGGIQPTIQRLIDEAMKRTDQT